MKINLITLGCAKNLVDSETLAGMLLKEGLSFTDELENADAIILSTCAFVGSARKEAYGYIKKITRIKDKNQIFIVAGCLPQLEGDTLLKKYPGIDAIFGPDGFRGIPRYLKNRKQTGNNKLFRIADKPHLICSSSDPRIITTGSFAYLKIADGCDNRCSYCLIPSIRGKYRERPIEDIVKEAQYISGRGIREIILTAQDTTLYGMKLYHKQKLDVLLRKLSKIKNIKWIRLLYTHPAHFTDNIINEIKDNDKVCKYVDIPVQHTHDDILKLMNRPPAASIFSAIEKLRKNIDDIALRTTVMTGFPGEEEKHFKKMLGDIKEIGFDWLGCFVYQKEKGTPAYTLKNQVALKIKKERYDKIMLAQQRIVKKKNAARVGNIYDVIPDSIYSGHAEFQSPEDDGRIYFLNPKLIKSIEPVKVKIELVNDVYDLEGEIIKKY